jgi:hypothetical protein
MLDSAIVKTAAFVRRPPPMALRYAVGVAFYGLVTPFIRIAEKLGRAERVLGKMNRRQQEQIAKKNPFAGYVPGKQDVIVATYAKSGTNWMMQIAHQLIYHGKGEFEHIHSVVPWPDVKLFGPMRNYAIPIEQADHWKTAPERKLVIKTHFNWEHIPYSEDSRYIMVIRDPKDVFVSNYVFVKATAFGPAMPKVDTWFNMYLSENFPMGGSWAVNAAGYWAQRHKPNVLVLSFKSMKRDLRGTALKVAEFLDIRVTDDVIQEVCRQSSFEYMKRIDHKFRPWPMIPWRPEATMIRKGAQGGSSEMLSPERQRQVDAYFMAEMKRLAPDFPYDEFCDVAS